jgi:hypothetical protein
LSVSFNTSFNTFNTSFNTKYAVGRFFVLPAALSSLWIATHPYRGIIHDGRLYTFQAMNTLQPGRFAQDLFFRFGSQDSLTSFSLFYSPLVAAFGPAGGHFFATVLGAAVWVMALVFLMRSLSCDRREALAAVLACIVLDAGYGGLNVFHYGEGFATPRIFAEALVMAALALCLRERLTGSILCLASAAAIHPIMAMTGMAVVGVWAASEDRRALLVIGLTAMAGVLLAAAGVEPFARLLISFDPDWFKIIWKRCGFGFLSRWNTTDALHLAAAASTLWVAHALGNAVERRLIVCLAIASAALLLGAFLGGELFRNVLLVNLQAWRVLWLDTLIANAAIAMILIRLPANRFSRELFLWAAGLSMLVTLRLQFTPIAALSQLSAALAFVLETRLPSPLPKWLQLLFLIAPMTGLAVTVFVLYAEAGTPELWQALVLTSLSGTALALLALCEARGSATVPLLCGATAAAAACLALFDQRTDWQKFVEASATDLELNAFAGGGNIYWDGGAELFWFKLKRPIYYSCLQGAGAMFHKGTAMEYERRSRGLSVLNSHDFSDSDEDLCFTKPFPGQAAAPTSSQLKSACQVLPELDTIVLPYLISGIPSKIWVAPAGRSERDGSNGIRSFKSYYKYSCEDFR